MRRASAKSGGSKAEIVAALDSKSSRSSKLAWRADAGGGEPRRHMVGFFDNPIIAASRRRRLYRKEPGEIFSIFFRSHRSGAGWSPVVNAF
jgi:hypothetical protein